MKRDPIFLVIAGIVLGLIAAVLINGTAGFVICLVFVLFAAAVFFQEGRRERGGQ